MNMKMRRVKDVVRRQGWSRRTARLLHDDLGHRYRIEPPNLNRIRKSSGDCAYKPYRSRMRSGSGVAVSRAALAFDPPVMIAVAVACLPIFASGHLVARWEGVLFVAYYGAYTLFLVMKAQQHAALPAFSHVMAAFAIPLTVVSLAVVAWREWHRR